MPEETFESSPAASDVKTRNKKYPFEQLAPGMSFSVNFEDVEEKSFRAVVSNAAKKYSRNFKCIKHDTYKCYEVAEIPPLPTFAISESSPVAKGLVVFEQPDYKKLPEGMSYVVPFGHITEEDFKYDHKKFRIIKHEDAKLFEIYCIPKAQRVPLQPVQSSPIAIENVPV